MRAMLGDRIAVNIDDLRHAKRGATLSHDTLYVPRKLNRIKRLLGSTGLTSQSNEKFRSRWLLNTIIESNASAVFVHFLDFATQFDDVWRRLDIPVVVHCHGYDITWDVRHHVTANLLHPIGYQDRVRGLSENVWFVANSNYTINQLLQLDINRDKIFLKRFGVPLAEKPKKPAANEPSKVLFLGRLVDFKGPLETVRAYAKIAHRHPTSSLEIAGGGPLESNLETLVEKLHLQSTVRCHGIVDQSRGAELRNQAAIFTAHNQTGGTTHQREAFGVSLLEAMGDGIPVVTGRSGGLVDFIEHGQNGLLFSPGDINAHAGLLDELLSSRQHRETLGAAAWETVRDNYQWRHEKEDLETIFAHVSRARFAATVENRNRRAA